ncbi:amidohydrolase family protein [Granulicella sp. dw_53]|uniref:amidohydrolase family protein n=1 Tax=Granulicella sp. dw_53 TaxID=2719792 RepID=UPI001BD57403|nr:amidohydrolase family protein [Granulicella sp. dw_53]
MRKSALLCLLVAFPLAAQAQPGPRLLEHGTYKIHLLLHTIGTEDYTLTEVAPGTSKEQRILTSTSTTFDRGMKRASTSTLALGPQLEPISLEQHATPSANPDAQSTTIQGKTATLHEGGLNRTMTKPPVAFVGFSSMPASLQMLMMRYWKLHHQPARLSILRASAEALPLEIRLVGHEAFTIDGRTVRLTRYTIQNLIWGREILWMNDHGRLAAVMTFAGGLPQEEVLDEYDSAASELLRSGVRQQVLDLADLDRQVPPLAIGSFAILGARLIDGTGAPALENSAVLIRDGRIVSVGTAASTPIPAGIRIIHAEGKSLLPGLWEMHVHYSGIEFGPALLSAGITTARDCGGEFSFLTTIRDRIDKQHALGPRLLLAGLIDSGGPLAFGGVDVETPAEAIQAVDLYASAHFEQIKVYTQIKPDILKVIADEAHKRGMTVTGHVPAAMNAFDAIPDGPNQNLMDQINHLQFVIRAMNLDGGVGPVDLQSDRSKKLIALLKQHNTVIDPTNAWGEMAGHSKDIDPISFEPGLKSAPYTLVTKYRALGVPAADSAKFRERMDTNSKVVRALYEAGIPIVAGSDTNLPGYGLDRELELYVQAGIPPIAAIQTATLNAARAMRLEKDSGSIEPGKRADLILVDGNPLANISDLRKVTTVVTNGRFYDTKRLAQTVGFKR